VTVELNDLHEMDTDFTVLEETGEATGVFEGQVDLTTDYYLNYQEDEDHLFTQGWPGTPYQLDAAVATYNGVTGQADAVPSLTDLLDESGASPAGFAVGGTLRVRVRDRYADWRAGQDLATATLITSGGDGESLYLIETGGRMAVFEVSLPIAAGSPVSGDGRIQAAAGQTVSVTHFDRNGSTSSSDSAAFTAASLRFLDAEGRPTDLYLDGSKAFVRAVDLAANTDPYTFQSVSAAGSMQLSGDTETISLRETGPDTGVFEGVIDLSIGYPYSGDQRLSSQPLTSPTSPFDTLSVSYAGLTDSAGLTGSIVRLLDEEGEEASSFALGSTVRIRVETDNDSPFIDAASVEVRSLTTGDVETLDLQETGGSTDVFEGSIVVVWNSAAPGDGYLEADAGETLRVTRLDEENGYTFSQAEAAVVRSSVRFVDAEGNTEPVLLEMGTARVRVTDLMSSGQPVPPDAEVKARLTNDLEPLSLAAILGSSFVFEGSVPLRNYYYTTPGDGYLATSTSSYPVNQPDTVTATSNGASAEAITAPAILEFVDDQGEPQSVAAAGALLHVRARSAVANMSPSYANILQGVIKSYRGNYQQYLFLQETGADTGIFEGTVQTVTGSGYPGPGAIHVEPSDMVAVVYDADPSTYDDTRETSAVITIVPSTVELVDAQGEAVSSYLFGEPVRVRVTDSAANANPGAEEGLLATIQAVRLGDDRVDFETVPLTETGPDTGVFTGSLATVLINYGATPTQENGQVELRDTYPPYGELSTVTASRNGVSASALMEDSRLRLTDAAGEPAEIFPLGGQAYIRLERPAGNTTAGVDTEEVEVWTSDGYSSDFEVLTLTETGDDTGIFTGSIAIASPPFNSYDDILEGYPGATFHVEKVAMYTIRSADTGTISGVLSGDPVAANDSATTPEDTPVTINVTANDTDPNGDTLGVIAVTQGTKGTVTFTPAGSTVTYTPNPNATGSDSFTYEVSDFSGLGDGNTDTATVFVTITPVNDPPDALDDSATTNEDTAVYVPVLANDSDPDGTLTITAATQGAKGITIIEGDGTIRYQPNGNATGADSFTYTVSDGSATDTATVSVTINPVNDAPVAWNDSVTTAEDTAITFAILANDVDVDGDPLTPVSVGSVANGTLVVNPDGTLTYTPNLNFRGFENFTYAASDPAGAQSTATVHIEITSVNDAPTAVNDSATTNEDTALNFNVAGNDTDPDGDNLVVSAVTQGAKGSVVINNSPSLLGKYVIYTPNANANGSDTFTYTISDGHGGTATGTVTMTITPVNDAPDAVTDSITTDEDTAITFDPKVNDTDVDSDTLTITGLASGGLRGTRVLNPDGTVTYTPNPNTTGSDFFQYTLSDGHGGTDTATVNVTITPVNDAPVANNDIPSVQEDTPVTINVLSNDSDVDGDVLTVTLLTQPTHGTAVLNPDKTVTYTPELNYSSGTDTFTYSVSDGHGGTDPATVFLNVIPVNDPPVAVTDSAAVDEDSSVTIAVTANDTDPENSALTVTAVTQGAHGTVTLLAGNQVKYQPAANYFGPDTFTYTVRDPANATAMGTVNVTVNPVNDPPVAVADSVTMPEDSGFAFQPAANDTDIDGDTLTVVAVTQSPNGTAAISGALVTFSPNANYNGSTSFTYTIRDAGGVERTATVSVTVTPVNDAPLAGSDTASTNENVPVTVSVLANDTDIDGGALSVTAVTQGAYGMVTTNGTTVTYTPAAGFSGTDSFTYNVSDGIGGGGGTATGLVTVSVAHVNGAPIAAPDSGSTREGVSVVIPVLANDTDADGGTLTVTAVGSPGVLLPDNTVRYTPGANFTGTVIFTYTVSDGQGGTAVGQVTVVVGEALERVAVLATNSIWLRSGSDVLSGDVIVNQATAGPYLNGAELSVGGSVTTPANYDVEGDTLTIAAGAVVSGDVSYNQLTNNGTIGGLQRTPLALPVFPALPTFLAATPGTTTINVANNGSQTLAPGSYLDLVVGRKGTVTFTGGVYHFRSITVDREAKLLFSAASEVRVQQKLSTKTLTTVGPAAGASIDASSILFYVAGINGTTGALGATPKAVEIGSNNTLAMNLYAPNGTTWLQDGTLATGAFLGKDIDVGLNVQVTLDSAWQ
jgi:VCBS repeat-containing protein